MKAFLSILRRKQPFWRTRKRPGRSLAMSFATLEARALLSIVGPVTSATVGNLSPAAPTAPAGLSLASSSLLNFAPGGSNSGGEGEGGGGGGWNHGVEDQGSPAPPFDRFRNHVALSEANVTVNGANTQEFALADAGESKVVVRFGDQFQTLGSSDGIDHPQNVELAYLNDDGASNGGDPYPDLIVVNSGSDNILVFPGLPGGQFGPALNGTRGFAVGEDPVSVSVADVDENGIPDLLVANQGSNTVSILEGTETGGNWGSNAVQTIAVGNQATNAAPVKVVYGDANEDGIGDLIVLNSGSNNVYVYPGLGNGAFNTTQPSVVGVGIDPQDMLLGQFDRHQQLDLVTVNAGSNDLTLIQGVLTANPTSQTISSGGVMPDAAFAFPGQNGMMDLLVANSGDGRLAFLQSSGSGLQLAGIITPSNLPDPTSLIPGVSEGNAVAFLAATAGEDAAQILSFDLGVSSTYLPTPLSASSTGDASDADLIASLMPFGESSLELVAVYWAGSPDQVDLASASNLREPSPITALYSPTEGQGDPLPTTTASVASDPQELQANPTQPEQAGTPGFNNFFTGNNAKFQAARTTVDELALQDMLQIDLQGPVDQFARLEGRPFDPDDNPDDRSHQGSVHEALRLPGEPEHNSSRKDEESSPTPSSKLEPPQPTEGLPTSSNEGQFQTVPLVSSVVLLSTSLIFRSSTPRPPSFRKGKGPRITPGLPEAGPPK